MASRYRSKDACFKKEAKLMILLPLLVILVGILAGIVVPYVLRQIEIDKCLDAGGSFDYQTKSCLFPADKQ